MLAPRGESTEAFAETDLGFPGDVLDGRGEPLEAFSDERGNFSGIAVGPGAFDEGAAGVAVAGFGDGSLAAGVSGGIFAGNEAEKSGELAGVIEACEVAKFRDQRGGDRVLDAAQGLEGLDERCEARGGDEVSEFRLETLEAVDLLADGAQGLLEDDLLGGGGTDDLGEVAQVSVVPISAAGVVEAETEEEGLETKLRSLQGNHSGLTGAAEVAKGFILDGRDVDGVEVTGAQQARQLDGVAPVGLDAVSWLFWDERWSNDQAGDPTPGEVAIEKIAARTGLVSYDEAVGLGLEPADEPVDVGGSGANAADIGDLGTAIVGDVGNRKGVLVNIETDEQRSGLFHG